MIDKEGLIKKVKSYLPQLDEKRLAHACDFSREHHGEQKRASGDPYYYHPLEVAEILADIKFDEDSIITALLHDTVEDTDVTLEVIEKEFGHNVRTLVDGVTKLGKIENQSEQTKQAENFRKLLVAMSEDIRVLIVKLADRLHNMRTLHFIKSPQKRTRIAHETMEIYSALAERIGMQQFKNEMQDLAFAELYPEARESIISRLEYLRNRGDTVIQDTVKELEDILKEDAPEVHVDVQGREKTPCSIWRKMERKNVSFEQLSDIMAFRILVDKLPECYRVLGVIHSRYKMVPENFKDFISTPKDNGYRSLHTVVLGPGQRFIEVQIRTKEMHEIAELGVAAHWTYKQDRDYSFDGKQYKWLRELLYILEHSSDSEEFFENTKLEMYYDQVFCFTPRGELVALPRGATPVDFAYEVHSSIGNSCSGAKVNGRIVPLKTILHNGDQVEVITSKMQTPSPAWESFVVTGKAKSEIRRFVRSKKREEYIKLGESVVEKILRDGGVKKVTEKRLEVLIKAFGKKNYKDFYANVGEGLISGKEIWKVVFPDKKVDKKNKGRFSSLFKIGKAKEERPAASIPIKGMIPGMALDFAECCTPIPGDSIVGVITTGKGLVIHTSDCEMLTNFANTPERLVDVAWGKQTGDESFTGRIKATLVHEAGSLAALTSVIARSGGNIINLKITDRSEDFFEMIIDVGVKGAKHLSDIITSLRSDRLIHSVDRYKG